MGWSRFNEYLNFMQIWTNCWKKAVWASSSQLPEGGSSGLGCRKVVFLHWGGWGRPAGTFQGDEGSAGVRLPPRPALCTVKSRTWAGPAVVVAAVVRKRSLVLADTPTVPGLAHRFLGESHSSRFSGSWAVQAFAAHCTFSSHQPAAGGG